MSHETPSEEEEDELRVRALRKAGTACRTLTPFDYLTTIRTSQRGKEGTAVPPFSTH